MDSNMPRREEPPYGEQPKDDTAYGPDGQPLSPSTMNIKDSPRSGCNDQAADGNHYDNTGKNGSTDKLPTGHSYDYGDAQTSFVEGNMEYVGQSSYAADGIDDPDQSEARGHMQGSARDSSQARGAAEGIRRGVFAPNSGDTLHAGGGCTSPLEMPNLRVPENYAHAAFQHSHQHPFSPASHDATDGSQVGLGASDEDMDQEDIDEINEMLARNGCDAMNLEAHAGTNKDLLGERVENLGEEMAKAVSQPSDNVQFMDNFGSTMRTNSYESLHSID